MSTCGIIVTERPGLAGGIVKETAEIDRAVFDFRCWLDTGEIISKVRQPVWAPSNNGCAGTFRVDYPLCCEPGELPADTVPLVLSGLGVRQNGKIVDVLLGNGTPGLSYIVSFLAHGSTSGRLKQVNFCVSVDKAVTFMPVLDVCRIDIMTVNISTELLQGTSCIVVEVANTTGGEITITLPPDPVIGQVVRIVDIAGNTAFFTVHIVGAAGDAILAGTSYELRVAYQSAEFVWDGLRWVVLT